MTDAFMMKVSRLTKHYGETRAVDGISFTVPNASVFTILGPNGAGYDHRTARSAPIERKQPGQRVGHSDDVFRGHILPDRIHARFPTLNRQRSPTHAHGQCHALCDRSDRDVRAGILGHYIFFVGIRDRSIPRVGALCRAAASSLDCQVFIILFAVTERLEV